MALGILRHFLNSPDIIRKPYIMLYVSIVFLVELAVKHKTSGLAVAEKNNRKSKVHESYANVIELIIG